MAGARNHAATITIVFGLVAVSLAPALPLAGATDHDAPHLVMPHAMAGPEQTLVVPIRLENVTSLADVEMEILYDPSVVEIVNFSLGTFPAFFEIAETNESYDGFFAHAHVYVQANGPVSGDHVLVYAGLRAVGPLGASTPLVGDVTRFRDGEWQHVSGYDSSQGHFTVSGGPAEETRTVSGTFSYAGSLPGHYVLGVQAEGNPDEGGSMLLQASSFPAPYQTGPLAPGRYILAIWKENGGADGVDADEPVSFRQEEPDQVSWNLTLDLTQGSVTGFDLVLRDPPSGGWWPGFFPGDEPAPAVSMHLTYAHEAIGAFRVLPPGSATSPSAPGAYALDLRVTGASLEDRPTTTAPSGPNPRADGFTPANLTVTGDVLSVAPGDVTLVLSGTRVERIHVENVVPTRVNGEVLFHVTWRGLTHTLTIPITVGAHSVVQPSQIPVGTASTLTVTVEDHWGNRVPSAQLRLTDRQGDAYPGADLWMNGTGHPGNGQNGQYAFTVAPQHAGELVVRSLIGSNVGGHDLRNWTYARVQVGDPSSAEPCVGSGSIGGRAYTNHTPLDGNVIVRIQRQGCGDPHSFNLSGASFELRNGMPYSFDGLGGAWTVSAFIDSDHDNEPGPDEPHVALAQPVDASLRRSDVNIDIPSVEPSRCAGAGSLSGLVFSNQSAPNGIHVRALNLEGCFTRSVLLQGNFTWGVPYTFTGLAGQWSAEAWIDSDGDGEKDIPEPSGTYTGGYVDAHENRTDANIQVSGGSGPGYPPYPPPVPCQGQGTISGRVFTNHTTPQWGAFVRATRPGCPEQALTPFHGDFANGAPYTFSGLHGNWTVDAWLDHDGDANVDPDEPHVVFQGPVDASLHRADVDLSIGGAAPPSCEGTGSVSGLIFSNASVPMNGVLVRARSDVCPTTSQVVNGLFGQGVRYAFHNLSGPRVIEAWFDHDTDGQPSPNETFSMHPAVDAADNRTDANLQLGAELPPGGGGGWGCARAYDPATTVLLQGYVQDSRRRSVANASVQFVMLPSRNGEGYAQTDGTGFYACVVPGGRYQLEAYGDGGQSYLRANLTNGTTEWVNHTLSHDARPPYDWPTDWFGGTVWGNVTVAGEGRAGIRVHAYPSHWGDQCNQWAPPGERVLRCYAEAETDAEGRWALTGLANGTYNVQFDGVRVNVSIRYVHDAFRIENATTQDETRVQLATMDFPAPAFIRGRVEGPGGAPVVGADVHAWPSCDPSMPPETESCGTAGWKQTDENGEYVLVVSAGRYSMVVQTTPDHYEGPPLHGARRHCYVDPRTGPAPTCTIVTAGNATWANFTLTAGHVLSGRVVKSVNGTDVPVRASISAQSTDGQGPTRFAWTQTSWNGTGWFSVTMEPGTYQVRVEPDRWENPDLGIWIQDGVVIPDVGDLHLGDVRLGAASTIEGQVTDADGAPIHQVSVHAYMRRDPNATSPPAFGGWAQTDRDGRYRLVLQAGTYEVIFDPPYGSAHMRARNDSVVVHNGLDTRLDVRLSQGGVLTGYVLAPNGTGVAGASVDAWWQPADPRSPAAYPQAGTYGHALTDASGHYVIRALANGTFGMNVRPPLDSSLSSVNLGHGSGQQPEVGLGATTWKNFTLRAGSAVTGCVKDPTGAEGVPSAWITIFSMTEGFGGESTREDGCFTLRGVLPGLYDLVVNPPHGSTHGRVQIRDVRVTEGVDLDLGEILLRAGQRFSGRVVNEQGQGLPNVYVNAHQNQDGASQREPGAYGFAQTDADGSFVIHGLNAGRYGVHVQPFFNSGYSSRYIRDVAIDEGGLDGYVVTLGLGGWINGTVIGPDGQPIPNVWIGTSSAKGLSGGGALTDAQGRFNVSGLVPADDYYLEVSPSGGHYDLATYREYPVTVVADQGTLPGPWGNGTIMLARGGTLAGRVVDANGEGIGQIGISVGGQGTFGWGMTDQDGAFAVRGLSVAEGAALHVYVHPPWGSPYVTKVVPFTWAADNATGIMHIGDIDLGVGRNFTGNVTRGGLGVADVDVHVWPSHDEQGRPLATGGASTLTDASGAFALTGLAEGTYDVSLYPRDGSAGRFLPRGVIIASANDTTGVELVLESGGDLPVRVHVEGATTPLADAQVDCFSPELRSGRANRTDAAGETLLQGLAAGPYKCRVVAAGHAPKVMNVTVAPGPNPTLDVGLAPVPTSTVTGRYANGTESGSHFVILVPADGEVGDGDSTGFNTTASDGTFVIPDMPFGVYDVKIVSPAGVLVALREDVVVDDDPEPVGDLIYDPTLGG